MAISVIPTFEAPRQVATPTLADLVDQLSAEQQERRRTALQEQMQAQLFPLQLARAQQELTNARLNTPEQQLRSQLALKSALGEIGGVKTSMAVEAPAEAGGRALTAIPLSDVETQAFESGSQIPAVRQINEGLFVSPVEQAAFRADQQKRAADQKRAEALLENEMALGKVQTFAPGVTVGTPAEIMKGGGVKVPEKGTELRPFHYEKVGDKLLIFEPGKKDPVNTITVDAKADVKSTAQGIFREKTPGKADYELVPGTEPTTKTSEKALTESQASSRSYGNRMIQAETVFDDLESKGFRAESMNPMSRRRTPQGVWINWLTGGLVDPNIGKTTDFQRFEQATRNFVNASLRRESGATITPQEMENAVQQYIPIPGDAPETVEQKRQNRLLQSRTFLETSGLNEPEIDSLYKKTSSQTSRSGTPQATTAESYLSKHR